MKLAPTFHGINFGNLKCDENGLPNSRATLFAPYSFSYVFTATIITLIVSADIQ